MLCMGLRRRLLLIGIGAVLVLIAVACFWIKFETTEAIEAMPPEERP